MIDLIDGLMDCSTASVFALLMRGEENPRDKIKRERERENAGCKSRTSKL